MSSLARETCQLLQHPITPPRKCMTAKELSPGGLPLDVAKPPTQKNKPFTLSGAWSLPELDTVDQSFHSAKTSKLSPIPTGKFVGTSGLSS